MKIALLEDNPTNRELIQTLLEIEGYQVFPYSEGHPLLTTLESAGESFPYDVVIIDLLLPNTLSGLDVMHHIQQEHPSQLSPFVVVSALSRNELDRVQADFPQTPIIRKPFKHHELLEAIHLVLTRP